jgi:glycogen operon protein
VHAFIDEFFLHKLGLRNYWGYNTLNYFAPAGRLAGTDPIGEFCAMVDAIHDAGIEVILDVVYNHTAETDEFGPTLSYRGIDNMAYYRVVPESPADYVNDTGCGNTLNADHPVAQQLVIDSLVYWYSEMGVDGFRFDLATVLGRRAHGFDAGHPLLKAIEEHPDLKNAKLVAEPWDIGPGGYRVGGFGPDWSEWNDRYRDSVRRFWRGDTGEAGEFARRVHGSAEMFETKTAGPAAGINFITSHDGFTLTDVVTYAERHNEANGQQNQDGHSHNYSSNYGWEGPSGDTGIEALRRRQRLNMIATVLVSTGTPMLLAGDEFGNSQQGNNNAYAQDNEIAWLDWQGLTEDEDFTNQVRQWIALRSAEPLLRAATFIHEEQDSESFPGIVWLRPDGATQSEADWHDSQAFGMILSQIEGGSRQRMAILFNASMSPVEFVLPSGDPSWELRLTTGETEVQRNIARLEARCLAALKNVSG